MEMAITHDILKDYKEKNLIRIQKHPELDLYISNYTKNCEYNNLWDENLPHIRGLITDKNGIVVKTLSKFWNYSQLSKEERNNIDWSEYTILQEKEDGCFGLLFYYKDRWILASRGSFDSDVANDAKRDILPQFNLDLFDKKVAYAFEIIHENHPIVVNYTENKFMFFSAFKMYSDKEYSWEKAYEIFKNSGITDKNIVKTKKVKLTEKEVLNLQEENLTNKEGYVVRFNNFRFKVKFDEYFKIHSLMKDVTTKSIWKLLINNENIETLLSDVPDEIFYKIKEYENKLKDDFSKIREMHTNFLVEMLDENEDWDKKKFFFKLKDMNLEELNLDMSLLLFYVDGSFNKADRIIWKKLKPKSETLTNIFKNSVIICIGPPGVGKSTWANSVYKKMNAVIANRDSIRNMLFDMDEYKQNGGDEELVTKIERTIMLSAKGRTVINDNTNCDLFLFKNMLEFLERNDIKYFFKSFDLDLDEIKRRNNQRDGWKRVPDEKVEKMYSNYLKVKDYIKKMNK